MALYRPDNFPAAGKTELLVEFAGFVKEYHLLRLFREEFLSSVEESEVGISEKDVFEVRYNIWLGLDQVRARTILFLAFFLEFLGGFGDQKGCGEVGEGRKNVGFARVQYDGGCFVHEVQKRHRRWRAVGLIW